MGERAAQNVHKISEEYEDEMPTFMDDEIDSRDEMVTIRILYTYPEIVA